MTHKKWRRKREEMEEEETSTKENMLIDISKNK